MRNFLLLCFAIIIPVIYGHSQDKYWVYLEYKIEGFSYEPQSDHFNSDQLDFNLNSNILQKLSAEYNIKPLVRSKWLNAFSCYIPEEIVEDISNEKFVKKIVRVNYSLEVQSVPKVQVADLNKTLNQIHAEALIDLGLNGQGVKVGIIDRGFLDANNDEILGDIFWDKYFKEFRNFTHDGNTAFSGSKSYSDDHGTRVWRLIGGNSLEEGRQYGLATRSDYYLAKTDRGDAEFKGEEDYWIAAVEWLDSLGIKIINSSLGYSNTFDNPLDNYKPSQIDGKSSPISQAAQIASKEKGILIIAAAGNQGDEEFKVLSVPADSKDVLTVGATSQSSFKKMSFSSIGGGNLSYVKPDISCYSRSGTSFTAPVITGLAACMMQFNNNFTNEEIRNIIMKSSHLYPYPNNYVGYGVPDARKIAILLKNPTHKFSNHSMIHAKGDSVEIKSYKKQALIYHKLDSRMVSEERLSKPTENKLIITRPRGIMYSTFTDTEKVVEIKWPEKSEN